MADSQYGKHDVSPRRGDALAVRGHMEEEDLDLHLNKAWVMSPFDHDPGMGYEHGYEPI